MINKLALIIVGVLAVFFCNCASASQDAGVSGEGTPNLVTYYVYEVDPYFGCDHFEYVNGNLEYRYYNTFWFGETPTGGSFQLDPWLSIPNVYYDSGLGRNMCISYGYHTVRLTHGTVQVWAPVTGNIAGGFDVLYYGSITY